MANEGQQIFILEVNVNLGPCIDIRSYAKGIEKHGQKNWEWMTERLSLREADKFGFDSISINSGTRCHEFDLYRPKKQILDISMYIP